MQQNETNGSLVDNQVQTGHLWNRWYTLSEVWILLLSVTCFACLFLWYGGILTSGEENAGKKAGILLGTMLAHLAGGVIPGVSTCAGSDYYSPWENVLMNGLTSIGGVSLIYGFFCLSCRKLLKIPLLEDAFAELQKSASSQKKTWRRLGIPGIFLFVWIPFFMTGPIVGAILGRLIGLGVCVNLLTVCTASLTSIATWVFFWEQLSRFVRDEWLKYFSIAIVMIILSYVLSSRLVTFWKQLKR